MSEKKRKVVYTAVFGSYDNVPAVNPKWDCFFICFTDNPGIVSNGWKIETVKLHGENPTDANRRYKILAHHFFPNYDQSLYVDGNIKILNDPSILFEQYLDTSSLALPKHQERNCLYEEANHCLVDGKIDEIAMNRQLEKYASENFPKNYGLTENGVMLRNHNNKKIIKAMELWWEEYFNGTKRDQISLQYVLWKFEINYREIIEGPRVSNKYFSIKLHKNINKSIIKKIYAHIKANQHRVKIYNLIIRFKEILIK